MTDPTCAWSPIGQHERGGGRDRGECRHCDVPMPAAVTSVRIEWGYEWTKPDGTTYVRMCEDEDEAREHVEHFPDRAVLLTRAIQTGPWTTPMGRKSPAPKESP